MRTGFQRHIAGGTTGLFTGLIKCVDFGMRHARTGRHAPSDDHRVAGIISIDDEGSDGRIRPDLAKATACQPLGGGHETKIGSRNC